MPYAMEPTEIHSGLPHLRPGLVSARYAQGKKECIPDRFDK